MSEFVSLEGPIEAVGDSLVIRIPMEFGGAELADSARGISTIEDGHLVVVVEPWLASMLRIEDGSLVVVDNKNGKFNITRSAANDL
jgi:hypothetical protein